jgi:hypothetical protein
LFIKQTNKQMRKKRDKKNNENTNVFDCLLEEQRKIEYHKILTKVSNLPVKRNLLLSSNTTSSLTPYCRYLFQFQSDDTKKLKQSSKKRKINANTSFNVETLNSDVIFVPEEVIIHILSYLPMDCLLGSTQLVCKDWFATIRKNMQALLHGHNYIILHLKERDIAELDQIHDEKLPLFMQATQMILKNGKIRHVDLSGSKYLTENDLFKLLINKEPDINSVEQFNDIIKGLVSLDLTNCQNFFTKTWRSSFSEFQRNIFPNLKSLSISGINLPSYISSLSFENLRILDASNLSLISMQVFPEFRQLEEFYICNSRISLDIKLLHFAFGSKLRILDVSGTLMQPSLFIDIISNCERLEIMNAAKCTWLNSQCLYKLCHGKSANTLTSLNIASCMNVTDESMSVVAKTCKSLRFLNVSTITRNAHVKISSKVFEKFHILEELDVSNNKFLCQGSEKLFISMLTNRLNLHHSLKKINCVGYITERVKGASVMPPLRNWSHLLTELTSLEELQCEEGRFHKLSDAEIKLLSKVNNNNKKRAIWVNLLYPSEHFVFDVQ